MSILHDNLFQISWADEQAKYESRLCEATMADLTIQSGDVCLTRNEVFDFDSQKWSTRDHVRLCLHPLAIWFASNFYRLLYEEPLSDGNECQPIEWALTHGMENIGDGFLWPPITIHAYDNDQCILRPSHPEEKSYEHVRYTETKSIILPVDKLQEQILSFLHVCQSKVIEVSLPSTTPA